MCTTKSSAWQHDHSLNRLDSHQQRQNMVQQTLIPLPSTPSLPLPPLWSTLFAHSPPASQVRGGDGVMKLAHLTLLKQAQHIQLAKECIPLTS
jgi:hypothetical protein